MFRHLQSHHQGNIYKGIQEVHHGKNSNQITQGYSLWWRWQNWHTFVNGR